jgi:hypothetical protein
MYMKLAGLRTLICGAIVALAVLLLCSGAHAQEPRYSVDQPKPDASEQPGRYQIIMHPTFRADQYLLDTATGQIWQLQKFGTLQGEPEAWKFMTRLDNQTDYMSFIMSRPNKKLEGSSETPSAAQTRSKPPAPLKLN